MRMVDVIAKKRDGQALSDEEIRWFVQSYTRDDLPDYQVSALLMAICIQGMSDQEVTTLTIEMANSGDVLDLSDISDYVVDKHSSGGVGDKTSLVVLPLVAACGIPVAKMSGRGLGYTGGTLDKIEAIPGYNVDLTETQFREQAQSVGITLAGQSKDLAPADGKLYALRDVSGTVPSIPLIASSIMSKKIAAGAHGIVLDVKVGSGAFMKTLDEARSLAETMVSIGDGAGRQVVALISDMSQPLGRAVGHSLEVKEAIATLKGEGPQDFYEHCLEVASYMLVLAGQGNRWTTPEDARTVLEQNISNGRALQQFRSLVEAQGGDATYVDDPDKFTPAKLIESVTAAESGYVSKIDAETVARVVFSLGGGRVKKGDPIDHAVGAEVLVSIGDEIKEGQPLVVIHAQDENALEQARTELMIGIEITQSEVESPPLFYDVIGADQFTG